VKRKYISALLSITLIVSLFFTGSAFAKGNAYGSWKNAQKITLDLPEGISWEAEDETAVTTDSEVSELETTDPAEDIASASEIVYQVDYDKALSLTDEVYQAVPAATVYNLRDILTKIKEAKASDAGKLVELSRMLNNIARTHRAELMKHPGAKRAVVLLTDFTVRLAYHHAKSAAVKLIVYRNAAQTYAILGCYLRAEGVLKLAAKISDYRSGIYNDLKNIFKKTGKKGLKLFIRGQQPDFKGAPPVIENGRTLVPLRIIAENLGAQIGWDPDNRKVTIVNGNVNINLVIGNNNAVINGKKVSLDVPPSIKNNRTMVPLRFISEHLGAQVDWDEATQTITVE